MRDGFETDVAAPGEAVVRVDVVGGNVLEDFAYDLKFGIVVEVFGVQWGRTSDRGPLSGGGGHGDGGGDCLANHPDDASVTVLDVVSFDFGGDCESFDDGEVWGARQIHELAVRVDSD